MKLQDLQRKERADLARRAGMSPEYLHQCGTGFRTLSPRKAKKLIELDPRLSWDDLYTHVRSED